MAGHECHFVEFADVPGADDHASGVGVVFDLIDNLGNLVNVFAASGRPGAPLNAVDRAEVAIRGCPFVPDGDAAFLEPAGVGVAIEEPQEFIDDGFEVNFFGGDEWETFLQVKAHLVTEDAACACACAVCFCDAVFVNVAHKVFVLGTDRVLGKGGGVHIAGWLLVQRFNYFD